MITLDAPGGDTDSLSYFQAAYDDMPTSGCEILVPVPIEGYYTWSADLILRTGKSGLRLVGERKRLPIHCTSTTANGITIQGEHNWLAIENLFLYAVNTSTGTAVSGIATGSSTPLRDFEFLNLHPTQFLKGFVIYGGINGVIRGGRLLGLGKTVPGGIGIQLGEDYAHAWNKAVVDEAYISSFETGLYQKFASPLTIPSSILGSSAIGLKVAENMICEGNLFFESNTLDIENHGYLTYRDNGGAKVTTSNRRIVHLGSSRTKVNVSLITANQNNITTSTDTRIAFNSVDDDSESFWSSNKFTANYHGFYKVNLVTQWRAGTANKMYSAKIYKNGSVYKESVACGPSAVPQGVSVSVNDDAIWLEPGDYIEGYCRHEEGINSELVCGCGKTYMSVCDA